MSSTAKWFFTAQGDHSTCDVCGPPSRGKPLAKAAYVLISTYKRFINPDDLKDLSYELREARAYRCSVHAPKAHAKAMKERDAKK